MLENKELDILNEVETDVTSEVMPDNNNIDPKPFNIPKFDKSQNNINKPFDFTKTKISKSSDQQLNLKKQADEKLRQEKFRLKHPQYVQNKRQKEIEIEEFLSGDLSDIIGSDQTNWVYALPEKAGGRAEEKLIGKNNYLKLLNQAKSEMFDSSLEGEFDIKPEEFDEMFLNNIKRKADAQMQETINKAVEQAELVGADKVEIQKRKSLAELAKSYNMPFDDVLKVEELNKNIFENSKKIAELKEKNPGIDTEQNEELADLMEKQVNLIGERKGILGESMGPTKIMVDWDNNMILSSDDDEDSDTKTSTTIEDLDEESFLEMLSMFTQIGDERTDKEILSENLDLNYRKQILHNKKGKELVNVTINNIDADRFLRKLDIVSTGENKNGKEYSIPFSILSRYYNELVVSEGDVAEFDARANQFRTDFESPDGYFALTSNVDSEKFTTIQQLIDQGEFSSKDDPNKAFKRSLKDYNIEHFDLIKERTILTRASVLNIDPSSTSRYDFSVKGVKDYFKNVNTILNRGAGLDYTELQSTDASVYKWGSRQVDLQLEEYFTNNGITLSTTLKHNLKTTGLYEFSERFTEFMPVIGKFFLIDGVINKTGLLKGAVSLANRSRQFKNAQGVLLTDDTISAATKLTGLDRGSDAFKMYMQGKGFTAVAPTGHQATMEFAARAIIEEAKMFTAFQEHYKLGGGTAFLTMGKMMGAIFPNTLAGSNQMLTFLGVGRSGMAGMISTQMAANLEAFIEDLRGNEAFATHVNEFYGDLDEAGRSALLDFAVFSALGIKGVYSIKGAGPFGGFKSTGNLRKLVDDSRQIAEQAYKDFKKDPTNLEARKKFQKYSDIYSQVQARLDFLKPSKERTKEIAEKSIEAVNKFDPEANLKIKIKEGGENSYDSKTNTITLDPNNPQHLSHELGHWLKNTKVKKDAEMMFDMFNMMKGSFPGLEKSIIEAYGKPIKDKQGKETGDYMLDRDLTIEEFVMHTVSKLGEVGNYNNLVANNVFRRLAENTNNYFISKFGKEFAIFGKYDLTTKSEVIRFWGNFAKVVTEGNLTEKYLKFMKKTLNDPKYQEYLERKITLDEYKDIIKDPQIQEQVKKDAKFAKNLESKVETEMMALYNAKIMPFSMKGHELYEEDLEVRKEKESKAIAKNFLQPRMVKGPDGKRVRVDAAANTIALWFATKTRAAYPDMSLKDVELLASVALNSKLNRGVKNIIENYGKYETSEGKSKQDLFKTVTSQLMLRQADLYKEAFPDRFKDKQLGGKFTGDIKEGMLGTTEIKDFDIVDKQKALFNTGTIEIAPNFNVDLVGLETNSRNFLSSPNMSLKTISSANSIYKWFSENTKLETQLKDNAYVTEKSQNDLKAKVEKEMIEEVRNPESEFYIKNFDLTNKVHTNKLEKFANKKYKKDLIELRRDFIFSKADLIEMSLPKNIDMTTGESNFVTKTFGALYTNTGKRYKSADYPGDATASKKGEGGDIIIKKTYSSPLEAKRAIMDVIFKPAEGGKPLTNAQIKTRIESAMKYVTYTIANQSARKYLNNADIQSMLTKSNAPLINSLIIKKEYNNVIAKAKKTLGSEKLFAKDLTPEFELAAKAKNSKDLAKIIYGSTRLVNEFDKAGVDVKILVDNLSKTLFKDKSFSIFDQIPVGSKPSEITLVEGKDFTDGVKKIGFEYDALLITSKYGKNHKAAVYKDRDLQEMVYQGYADMANGITKKVGGKDVVVGGLPVEIVSGLMFNKFIGSGSVRWATGVYQKIGVSQSTGKPKWLTFSSDAVKKMKADYKIVGNPNIKLSKKELQAIKDFKIVDNSDAKRINIEILKEFRDKKADFSDPKVQDQMRIEFNKRTGYTKKVVEANEVVLETMITSLKKYYDAHPNKVTAMNNLIFTLGTQTSIGNGPIRGLASHRSFSINLKELLDGSRSEHGIQAQTFSLNVLKLIKEGGVGFKTKLKKLIKEYKQDIITSKTQKAADYVTIDGVTKRVSTEFPPEAIDAGSQATWLKTTQEANNQVLMFGDYKTMGGKYTGNVVNRLVNDLATKGVSKKYAKSLPKENLIEKLIKIEKANRGVFGVEKKGGTFLDLDDTLVFTNSKIKWTSPDGKKGELNAEQYAKTYESLAEQGYKFDFSEFNEIKDPKLAPLFNKALKLQNKFGPEHMYIVTARPPEAAPAIHAYLKSKGLNIPFENITGLGNSTGEAKALFIAEKIGEGYNDIYFADDVLQNIQAVKNVVEQFDIKSKIQLARKKYALDLDIEFNKMIERTKGVGAEKVFSLGRAKIDGKNKKRFSLFMEPSAEDFMGLLYRFAGKGKQGDADLKLLEDALIKPFLRGQNNIDASKQSTTNDYKTLKKNYPEIAKKLRKKVPGSIYSHDVAIRVHRWTMAGFEIPDISKAEHKMLFEYVANNKELLAFSEQLGLITKTERGYIEPQVDWLADTITSDLNSITTGTNRSAMLFEFTQNRQALFGDWKVSGGKLSLNGKNMNKIEAVYGSRFREAMEDIMYRMEFGKKMSPTNSRIVDNWDKWVNGSVGSIMFLNSRSATLQMLSTVNYMNWGDNNPLKVAQTLANPKQFIKDLGYIMNSDMLQQRRKGLKIDINEAALASAVDGKSNPIKAAVAYLLKKGFMPTQIADSLAISIGGASFYRNRINTYKKDGLSLKEAEKKAWIDFTDVTQKTQQSSSPYLISQQQATSLGKTVLSFNNTPMQYNRIMKKAFLDIANKRGDIKTHISKIIYYGAAQNFIFHSLQQALFAMSFDETGEFMGKEEEKTLKVLNGMADTILRGTGLTGAVLSTVKNAMMEYYRQENKDTWKKDHTYTVLAAADLSPSIGSKLGGLYSSAKQVEFNQGAVEFMNPWAFNNPSLLAKAQVVESATNIPLARTVKKINNIKGALDNQNDTWQRIGMGMGWNSWQLGVKDREVQDLNEMFKKYKATERKNKKKAL